MTRANTATKTPIAAASTNSERRTRLDQFAADIAEGRVTADAFEFSLPSWKRSLLAVVLNVLVLAVGMTAAIYIASALAMLALSVTASAFFAICVYYFVGILLMMGALYGGSLIAQYVIAGKLADDMGRATTWLRGKFARGEAVIA